MCDDQQELSIEFMHLSRIRRLDPIVKDHSVLLEQNAAAWNAMTQSEPSKVPVPKQAPHPPQHDLTSIQITNNSPL